MLDVKLLNAIDFDISNSDRVHVLLRVGYLSVWCGVLAAMDSDALSGERKDALRRAFESAQESLRMLSPAGKVYFLTRMFSMPVSLYASCVDRVLESCASDLYLEPIGKLCEGLRGNAREYWREQAEQTKGSCHTGLLPKSN